MDYENVGQIAQVEKTNDGRARRGAPDERRELILRAAFHQCIDGKKSARGLSLVGVARSLGISRSLVYHYFPNQESLMQGLAEMRILDFLSYVSALQENASGTPEERLFTVMMGLSDYLVQASGYLSAMIRTQQGRTVVDAAVEGKIPQVIAVMKGCFDRPLSADADEVLYSLVRFIWLLLTRNSDRPREDRERFVRAAVRAVVAALAEEQKEQ